MLTRRQLIGIKRQSKGISKPKRHPPNDIRRQRVRSEEVQRRPETYLASSLV